MSFAARYKSSHCEKTNLSVLVQSASQQQLMSHANEVRSQVHSPRSAFAGMDDGDASLNVEMSTVVGRRVVKSLVESITEAAEK